MSRKIWNYTPHLPLERAPYYEWPIKPLKIALYLLNSWKPLGMRFFMMVIALCVWFFASPNLNEVQSFQFSWMVEIWVRNVSLLLIIAGGLHLLLWVFRSQKDEERYDLRPMARNAGLFLFKDQVKDNIFLSLGPGVLIWTFWECLFWWGYANGFIAHLHPVEHPLAFAMLILLLPIYAGFYFYLASPLVAFADVLQIYSFMAS